MNIYGLTLQNLFYQMEKKIYHMMVLIDSNNLFFWRRIAEIYENED